MRIVLMVPRLFPIPGGPEKLIFNLANSYANQGHETYVLAYEGAEKEFYSKYKFKVIFLPFLKSNKLKYLMKHLPVLPIVKILRSIKPDVIHVHDTPFVLPSMLYRKMFHNCPVVLSSHYFFSKKSPLLYRAIFGLNMKIAENVASVGKQMQDDTKSLYNVDSVLVPLCLNTEEFRRKDKKEVLGIKKKYKIPSGRKVILFLGRIVEQKNLELAIQSVAEAVKKDSDILFVIAGAGEKDYVDSLLGQAKKLGVENYIQMIGKVPEENIVAIYSMADLFLITTVWETISISAIEALSCSTPVVASDVGSMKDVVVNDYDGFLVKERDPKKFAEKIHAALKNSSFGKNGRKLIEENYSLEKVSGKYIKLYEKLINENKIKKTVK